MLLTSTYRAEEKVERRSTMVSPSDGWVVGTASIFFFKKCFLLPFLCARGVVL